MSSRSFRFAAALAVATSMAVAQGDDCSTALPLFGAGSGVVQTTPYNTAGFTLPDGNSNCFGWNDPADGMWSFTPSVSGTATFSICASSTVAPGGSFTGSLGCLATYSSCGALPANQTGCDFGGCGGNAAEVTVGVTAGVTMYVQIGDWNVLGGAVSGTLAYVENFAAAATNDTPAGATPVYGPSVVLDDNSFGNSLVDGPFAACGYNPSDDLWYYYTPAISGVLTVTTCPCSGGGAGNASGVSGGDTIIGVWADAGGTPGSAIDCNDDGCYPCAFGIAGFESKVCIVVTAGIPVFVSVAGWGGTGNGGTYALEFTEAPEAVNNECANAFTLVQGVNAGLTTDATTASPDQGSCYNQAEYDAWFAYTAQNTGVVEFSDCSTDGGAVGTIGYHNISVWSGACGALTQMNCNSQDWRNNFSCAGGQACRTQVNVVQGQTVYVAVAGFIGSQGTFDLAVTEFPTAPGNGCANAIPLPLGPGTYFVDTTSDGIAPDGSVPGCSTSTINGNYTGAWFAWTATCSGTATFTTCQTTGFFGGNDTVIMVYDNCPTNGGVQIACDDNNGYYNCGNYQLTSFTTFNPIPGQTYYLVVGGWAGDLGPITFDIKCEYKHVWTVPSGPGSIQLENVDGPPGAVAYSAITLDIVHPGLAPAVTFPNGWFFGVPLGYIELVQQIGWPGGLPFIGLLDPLGYLFNFALPAGTTSGLAGLATIWSVGVALDPLTGFSSVADTTDPTAFPL